MRRIDVFALTMFTSFLAARAAHAQEGCKPVTEAKKLPAVTALLDSSAMAANLPTPEASAPAEFLISVTTGSAPRAFIMDSSTALSAAGAAVLERVVPSLKPNARNAVPAFRIRVIAGPAASISVEPSILCAPRLPGPPPRQASFTITTQGRGGPPPRPRSVTPRLKIGVNGEVLQVDLGAGTGYPDGDRSLRQSLEGQRFEPATLDGRPVQVWMRGKDVEIVR